MTTAPSTPLDSSSPTQVLLRGSGLRALLWSCVSTGLLGLLLLDVYLTADLLIGQGCVSLTGVQAVDYERLTTGRVWSGLVPFSTVSRRSDQGLCATAWRIRDRFYGPSVAWLIRNIAALHRNFSALAVLILAGAAIGVGNGLVLSHVRALCQRLAVLRVTDLRGKLHRQALRMGTANVLAETDNDVVGLFADETERIRDGSFVWAFRLVHYPLQLLLLLILVLSLHWLLALQCLIPLAACWLLVQKEKRRFAAVSRLANDRARYDLRLLSEGIRNPRLICGYGMEEFEKQRFQLYLERLSSQFAVMKRSELWSHGIIRLLVIVCLTIVLFLVGSKTLLPSDSPHYLDATSALLLLTAFALIGHSGIALWQLYPIHRDVHAARERLARYLTQSPSVGQAVAGKVLRPLAERLHFESVTCSVPGRPRVLDQLELKLPAGDATAVVSLDPLEPKTLVSLLTRFIQPDSGRVLIDGQDIAWVTLESLRASTLFVDAANSLFTGTVFENITCGNPAYTLQEVTEAAQHTQAHELIVKLTNGYDTVLGEHGEQLDVGTRYAIALTRALTRDPSLLIVQEPESGLDEDAKTRLDTAYDQIVAHRTVLFLPSRLSTVRRANRVVLLHRGRVEDVQPYSRLIKSSAVFRHWEYVCFNEFRRTSGFE